MSPSGGPLDTLMEAMQQQKEKLTELVTVEFLMAQAGAASAAAYLYQVAEVKKASAAYAGAAAAVRAAAVVQKEWQERLQSAGLQVGRSFSSAAQFAEGLAQSANPVAWDTMMDSFKLVGMELGLNFLPMIIRVSIGAQELARWLQQLSPETKALIGEVAGIGAAMFVFGKAAAFANVALLGVPGKLAGMAGDKLGDLAASGLSKIPGAAWGAIGAFGVAAAAGLALGAALRSAAEEEERRNRERNRPPEEKYSRREVEESYTYRALSALPADPATRGPAAARILQDLERQETQAREQMLSQQGFFPSVGQRVSDLTAGPAGQRRLDAEQEYERIRRDRDLARLAGNELTGMGVFVPRRAEDFGGVAGRQSQGIQTLLAHFPKEMQPRFSAVEEARKGFQAGALKDPLEQEMLRLNREAAKKFLEMVPELMDRIRRGQPLGLA